MDLQKRDEIISAVRALAMQMVSLDDVSDDELRDYISAEISKRSAEFYLGVSERIDLIDAVFSSIRGMGLLDEIMNDENITEVMINGPDDIFVEKSGKDKRSSLIKLDKKFESRQKLEDIVQKIVGKAGREVSQSNPIVDTRLMDGSRVNVVMPPIALNGPIVTIRKFSRDPMTFERLIAYGSVTPQIRDLLKDLVAAKFNIFISGGTGSGKTTFLNALSNFIPSDERVITIEDSAELQIVNIPNLVRLETRNANSAGEGAISIRDLIKSALRMRPERIVVGEVRGGEALDMLQAMNTGHDGSLSTGHANSAHDMLSRLETMVLTGAEGLPLPAIRQQIASAIDIIVHLSRMSDKSRKTVSISEVEGLDEKGNIILNDLFLFKDGKLRRTDNPLKNEINIGKLLQKGKDESIFDKERFE